ncbi:hypothetical protein [Streptomyces erythrochromogenes]|uniref:hypothetical protein n=1 Tax=Streptomyces erythrochromogenes TaxID=285574 RepID=UPI0034118D09
MGKRITIVDTNGTVTTTTVADDETARSFEDLPFEAPHVALVTVTDADDRS